VRGWFFTCIALAIGFSKSRGQCGCLDLLAIQPSTQGLRPAHLRPASRVCREEKERKKKKMRGERWLAISLRATFVTACPCSRRRIRMAARSRARIWGLLWCMWSRDHATTRPGGWYPTLFPHASFSSIGATIQCKYSKVTMN